MKTYKVKVNDKVYEVQVESVTESNESIAAPAAPVAQPANAAPAAPASTGGAAVNAPVAGTLLKNCMAEGATVKAGDTIVMIESMKMELEVKATANGTVHYLASAGAAIQAGQPLAEIK